MKPTLVARLTAASPSAIATIAVSGPRALDAVLQFAKLSTDCPQLDHIYYGQWSLGGVGPDAVEQVVVCRTGQEALELHCHGGNAMCRGIVEDLHRAGCWVVTADAFLEALSADAGVGCPIAAAAEHDLMMVTTDRTAAILLDQMGGALSREIGGVLALLSSGDTPTAIRELDVLLRRSRVGLHLAQPWRVVLAGPPNVGKSSLINAIVGRQQSIVHHEPGTTRDWVEAHCAVDGWPVCLSDTAGLRDAVDEIEAAGVAKAHRQIENADLLIAVVDATQGWTDIHQLVLCQAQDKSIPVVVAWNKVDMGSAAAAPDGLQAVAASTLGEPGIDPLLREIADRISPETMPYVDKTAVGVPFRQQHVALIQAARAAIERQDTQQAVVQLKSLTPHLG